MTTASLETATTRDMSDSESSLLVGFTMKRPSTLPTRIPAMGPSKGMSDMCRAADAPVMARTSGSISGSTERTVANIWVSKL